MALLKDVGHCIVVETGDPWETIFSNISQWLYSEGTVPLSGEQSPPNP